MGINYSDLPPKAQEQVFRKMQAQKQEKQHTRPEATTAIHIAGELQDAGGKARAGDPLCGRFQLLRL